jgi:uncharacterized membrane protein
MGVGMLVCASLAGTYLLRRKTWNAWWQNPAAPMRFAAPELLQLILILITFAFSMEIDRAVERAALGTLAWPALQLKMLGWTMLWSCATAVKLSAERLLSDKSHEPLQRQKRPGVASILGLALVLKFVLFDTLVFRILHGPAAITLSGNVQLLAAMFVIGLMVILAMFATENAPRARMLMAFAALFVLVWATSLEIDRFFELRGRSGAMALSEARLAKQVAFSLFWSMFAAACVVAGFRFRIAPLRYAGLTLFALTLLKVLAVDLSTAETGWRIVSCMAVGLLMVGTSVVYGKFSPRLLQSPT